MNKLMHSRAFGWTLFLLFCVIWFYCLGARTLVPPDEGRYAEMAREMVASGNWITTRLNDIKYFEKPPLQVWMTALAFKFFGLGEWQARLWTGICGLLGILLTAFTARKLWGREVGLMAGLVLGSSLIWAAMGHLNTLDMSLSTAMALALCGLLLGQREGARPAARRGWMLASWAGMALAVMTKGPIGIVLPGAVLVLYTAVARDWRIWKRLQLILGALVFLLITTPWFVLVARENPEFLQFFFIHEQFDRFTTTQHLRDGPWYYFIPILLLGILPWLTVLFQSLWRGARSEAIRTNVFQPQKVLLIWVVFIFVFFSASHSKLPSYILPIFPALALLIALHLEQVGHKTWLFTGGLMAAIGAVALAVTPRLLGQVKDPLDQALYQAAEPKALVAAAILLACGAVVLWWARRPSNEAGFNLRATLTLSIGGFLASQLIMLATEPYEYNRSGRALIPAIEAELVPGQTLYNIGLYDQTIPFYMQKTTKLVLHPDELAFGLEQEPWRWWPNTATFVEEWRKPQKMVAIASPLVYNDLILRGAKMRIVIRDSRRIVITNDLKEQKQ